VSPPIRRTRRVGPRPAVVASSRPETPTGPFAERLASGSFTVACELPPNLGADGQAAIDAASALVNVGVDVLVIPPPRSSRPQIGPVPLGVLLRSRLEVETILTATTWDKSLLGLQADLLGAHAFDLRTVICRTGGPIPHGDYPNGAGMWDVDSVGLIELLRSLNDSDRPVGAPGGPTSGSALSFQIGASVNPNAPDLKAELRYARRKIDAGAHFLVTHPVFEVEGLRQVVAELDRPGVPILIGVMPLRDFEHAEYLHQEVPDIDLPVEVLERMRRAGPNGVRVGQDIATELVAQAAGLVQGLIMSPATSQLSETGEALQALLGIVADRR
jgi:homocysteine S-methyltransferase